MASGSWQRKQSLKKMERQNLREVARSLLTAWMNFWMEPEHCAMGWKEFDKDGIQELTGVFDDGVQKILDRIELVADAGKSYQTFSGAKTGMKGKVKFIIETGFEN